jgi:hypothetical protein
MATEPMYPPTEKDRLTLDQQLTLLEGILSQARSIHLMMTMFERAQKYSGRKLPRALVRAGQAHYFALHSLQSEIEAMRDGTEPDPGSVDPNNVTHHEIVFGRAVASNPT